MKILWLLLTILSLFSTASSYAEDRHTILLEAGSTGSRIHLLQYNLSFPIPEIKNLFSKEVKPGLSSFAKHPEAAGNSLKPILEEVIQQMRALSIDPRIVDINILASAGMRLLPEAKQQQIYTHLKRYLTMRYSFKIGKIKTISGQEEALYGWLAVNYLKGTFQRKEPSVGSIDMGGASTQIAFVTENTQPSPDKVMIVIDQQLYPVFSKSFLGLGQDQARELMVNMPGAAHCYPREYPMDQTRIGAFNKRECQKLYLHILETRGVRNQVKVPRNMVFIAYSGVYYAYKFFKVNAWETLEQRVQAVCNKTWEELQKYYAENRYLANYCANGVYIHELFFQAYQLLNEQLVVTHKINKRDIDWPLGALLYQIVQYGIHWNQSIVVDPIGAEPTTAWVSWNPALSSSPIVYDVIVKKNDIKINAYRNIKGNSVQVKGLWPDTIYSITVTARNAGHQVESLPVSFRTKN